MSFVRSVFFLRRFSMRSTLSPLRDSIISIVSNKLLISLRCKYTFLQCIIHNPSRIIFHDSISIQPLTSWHHTYFFTEFHWKSSPLRGVPKHFTASSLSFLIVAQPFFYLIQALLQIYGIPIPFLFFGWIDS